MTDTANAAQFAEWNGEGGNRWAADADRRDLVLAPFGAALLAAAQPRTGERVLDIGCGCGATSIASAQTLGHSGAVVGVDLSEPMLAVARARCAALGVDNARFEQADAQVDELGPERFDLAVSRFGTMFFDDQRAAFANIASVLRTDGRICIATWQPLVENEWLMVPGAPLLEYGSLPEQSGPGMFAQSDPAGITRTLEEAGLSAIEVVPVTVRMTLGAHADDATDYLATSGIGRRVLETIPEGSRVDALNDVRAALSEHADPTGVHLNGAIWITTAVRR